MTDDRADPTSDDLRQPDDSQPVDSLTQTEESIDDGDSEWDLRQENDSQPADRLTETVEPTAEPTDETAPTDATVDATIDATPPTPAAPPQPRRDWVAAAREWSRDVGAVLRDNGPAICLGLTLAGIVIWAAIFSSLGIRNHRNFGTWAFDMAIYDQAFWLVGQGGQTFTTVRGIDVWGHHLNLVAYVFAPFYRWLGAGPEFLYVVQNVSLALGALPVYLIAKLRFGGDERRWYAPYVGLAFAVAYLLYAPVQFIAWINFHPEAMLIAPFLFAWYFAMRKRWKWFFVFIVIAMAMREDTALAVIMLGIVLLVVNRHSDHRRRDFKMGLATLALGIGWYVIATQLIIRHFNHGEPPFYLSFFFQHYGGTFSGIVRNAVRHPNWIARDAVQPDRVRFYRDLTLPLGGLPLASPLHLLMAAPQMLASVIGQSPYARQILYQYTSVMIAPILIASVEGAHNVWRRFRSLRKWIVPWLLGCAYVTTVAWGPSPIGDRYGVWASEESNPRADTMQEAVELVPDDAATASTFNFTPHLSRRELAYDWPNPFAPAYWGNEQPGVQDCRQFPSASVVEYLVVDRALFFNTADPATAAQAALVDGLVTTGQFEVLMDERLPDGSPGVLVAERVEPGPDGEPVPVNCPGNIFTAVPLNGVPVPPELEPYVAPVTPTDAAPATTESPVTTDEPSTVEPQREDTGATTTSPP